jgi:hypothetical protein
VNADIDVPRGGVLGGVGKDPELDHPDHGVGKLLLRVNSSARVARRCSARVARRCKASSLLAAISDSCLAFLNCAVSSANRSISVCVMFNSFSESTSSLRTGTCCSSVPAPKVAEVIIHWVALRGKE